jgi:Kae1-associated kinase Bud32
VKKRVEKRYRVKELDEKLRQERTRSEARLLHKAKLAGIRCPTVLAVDVFEIIMSFVSGVRPKMSKGEARECGGMLAQLHEADIIHGDYTPANIIRSGKNLFVIES